MEGFAARKLRVSKTLRFLERGVEGPSHSPSKGLTPHAPSLQDQGLTERWVATIGEHDAQVFKATESCSNHRLQRTAIGSMHN